MERTDACAGSLHFLNVRFSTFASIIFGFLVGNSFFLGLTDKESVVLPYNELFLDNLSIIRTNSHVVWEMLYLRSEFNVEPLPE